MNDFYNAYISNAGDIVLSVVGWAMIIGGVLWVEMHDGHPRYIDILVACLGVIFAFTVRSTIVGTGRILADDGAHNHFLWFEWRWAVISILAAIALVSSYRLFRAIGRFPKTQIWVFVAVTLGLALVGAAL